MLWGSRSSLGSQPRRSSLAPQDQTHQQLPPSASGHPLRTSFQQQAAYAPDPAWERDRQAHLRLPSLPSQHAGGSQRVETASTAVSPVAAAVPSAPRVLMLGSVQLHWQACCLRSFKWKPTRLQGG